MERINASGGLVVNKRVMGLLAVARSFGDNCIKEYVIAEPTIRSLPLTSSCRFLAICCDGVFDVLSDEDVCTIVNRALLEVMSPPSINA